MTKHPTTLAAANNDPRVDSAYSDIDGVWIELTYGWANLYDEANGGLHSIHENTVRDALRVFRDVGPCDCPDCVAGLSKKAATRVNLDDVDRTTLWTLMHTLGVVTAYVDYSGVNGTWRADTISAWRLDGPCLLADDLPQELVRLLTNLPRLAYGDRTLLGSGLITVHANLRRITLAGYESVRPAYVKFDL